MKRSTVVIAAMLFVMVGCAGANGPSGPAAAMSSPAPLASSGSEASASTVPATEHPSIDATTPIPDALRYVWLGPARDIAALGGPQALSIIRFRDANFDYIFGGGGEEALNSSVAVPAPGQVRFSSANLTGGCRLGDEGTYAWATTADGSGLTMTKVSEACSARAAAVVGAWVRAACKEFGCLGDLEAGAHRTAFFEPLGDPIAFTGSWRMQYGSLSYVVPAGWANAIDDPNLYNLLPADDYAKALADVTRNPGIVLIPDVGVAAQDVACSPKDEPGVGQSATDVAARIARIPSLQVGPVTPISIAGRSGAMLDVSLKKDWSRFCATDGGVPVLRQGGDATSGKLEWDRRMTAPERWRLILLDVAKGRTMAILIDSADEPTRFDDLVARAMPIISSFELHLPAP